MVSDDIAALANVPSPLHMTLLLKCARHTVLLSVLPSTPFTEVASLLLLALKSRNINTIAGLPVPDPDQNSMVDFGIPKDKRDLKRGFIPLAMAERVVSETRTGKKKTNGISAASKDNLAGAGIVDGSILAFRFKTSDELEVGDEGDEVQSLSQMRWKVELPQYDDENE